MRFVGDLAEGGVVISWSARGSILEAVGVVEGLGSAIARGADRFGHVEDWFAAGHFYYFILLVWQKYGGEFGSESFGRGICRGRVRRLGFGSGGRVRMSLAGLSFGLDRRVEDVREWMVWTDGWTDGWWALVSVWFGCGSIGAVCRAYVSRRR